MSSPCVRLPLHAPHTLLFSLCRLSFSRFYLSRFDEVTSPEVSMTESHTLPVTAIIRMGLAAGQSSARATASIREIPEVLECSRVMGSDTLIVKVAASSVEHLEGLIDRLLVYGPLTTSVVLSTLVQRRVVTREVVSLGSKREDAAP